MRSESVRDEGVKVSMCCMRGKEETNISSLVLPSLLESRSAQHEQPCMKEGRWRTGKRRREEEEERGGGGERKRRGEDETTGSEARETGE